MKTKLQKEILRHFREIYIQAKSELKENVKDNLTDIDGQHIGRESSSIYND